MAIRWYDNISLKHISQIPNVFGIVTSLYNKKPGEVWELEEINELVNKAKENNLKIYAIESLNVSEDIKLNTPLRDKHIANYIESLRNLAKADIRLVCFNFMPLFDWTRTNLYKEKEDGSIVLEYNQKEFVGKDINYLLDMNNYHSSLPGWNNKEDLIKYYDLYQNISEEELFNNLIYFLKAIMPICNELNINMTLHPDDPAFSIFNIPRIVNNKENIKKIFDEVNDMHNGLTFCSGSFKTNSDNDLIDILNTFKDRINYVHLRNIKYIDDNTFEETSHLSSDGDINIYELLKTLYKNNYEGIIRPDHGRTIWDEDAIPGYGLYDRALGAMYITGILEALKGNNNEN